MTNTQFIQMLAIYWNTDPKEIIDKLITEIREKNEPLLEELMDLLGQICEPKKEEPKAVKLVMDEHGTTLYKDGAATKPTLTETPKPRKKPGRKPKTVKQWADDTVKEVRENEKMSKEEFVEYFGGKA